MKLLYLSLVACMFFYSCTDSYNICDTPRNVSLNAGLYHRPPAAGVVATANSLTLVPLNTTEFIYNQRAGLQNLSFDLIPTLDTAHYFIAFSNGTIGDTLMLAYQSQRISLPEPCGQIFIKTLSGLSYTRHSIDTAFITNPDVNTAGTENIRIYF